MEEEPLVATAKGIQSKGLEEPVIRHSSRSHAGHYLKINASMINELVNEDRVRYGSRKTKASRVTEPHKRFRSNMTNFAEDIQNMATYVPQQVYSSTSVVEAMLNNNNMPHYPRAINFQAETNQEPTHLAYPPQLSDKYTKPIHWKVEQFLEKQAAKQAALAVTALVESKDNTVGVAAFADPRLSMAGLPEYASVVEEKLMVPEVEWAARGGGPLNSEDIIELASLLARIHFEFPAAIAIKEFASCIAKFSTLEFIDELMSKIGNSATEVRAAFVKNAVQEALGVLETAFGSEPGTHPRLLYSVYVTLIASVEHRLSAKYATIDDIMEVYMPMFDDFSKGLDKHDLTMQVGDREWLSTLRIANLMNMLSKILPPNNNKAVFLYACALMGDLKEYSTATAAALSKHTQRTYHCILKTEASDGAVVVPAVEWDEHFTAPLTVPERTELAGILARCVSNLVFFDFSEVEATTGFQQCLDRMCEAQFLDTLFLVSKGRTQKTINFVVQTVTKFAEGFNLDVRARPRLVQICYAALLAAVEHRLPKKYATVEDAKAVYEPLFEQFESHHRPIGELDAALQNDRSRKVEWISVYRIANLMHALSELIGFDNNKAIFFYACTALGGIKTYKYRLCEGWMNKHSRRVCFVIWKTEGGADEEPAANSGADNVYNPESARSSDSAAPQLSSILEYSNSLAGDEKIDRAAGMGMDALGLLANLATSLPVSVSDELALGGSYSGRSFLSDGPFSRFSDNEPHSTGLMGIEARVTPPPVSLLPVYENKAHMTAAAIRSERAARERERVARIKVTDAANIVSNIKMNQPWAQEHKLTDNEQKLALLRAKLALTNRNDESILRALKSYPQLSSMLEYPNSLAGDEKIDRAAGMDALGLLANLATSLPVSVSDELAQGGSYSGRSFVSDGPFSRFSDNEPHSTGLMGMEARVPPPPVSLLPVHENKAHMTAAAAIRSERAARERERVARIKVTDAANIVSNIKMNQPWAQEHKLTDNEQKLALLRAKLALTNRNDESILRALKSYPTDRIAVMTGEEIEEVYRTWRSTEAARRKELRGIKRLEHLIAQGAAQDASTAARAQEHNFANTQLVTSSSSSNSVNSLPYE